MKAIFLLVGMLSCYVYAVEVTPTERLNESVEFADDLKFENMDLAIARQLKSYKQLGLNGDIKFGETVYPKSVLKDSLLLLQSIFKEARDCLKVSADEQCLLKLNQDVNAKFDIYRPVPGKGEAGYGKYKTKFTSYYSPDFQGSRVRTDRFVRPIYRTPDQANRNFSRVEIDYHGALDRKGFEIFWVEESFYDLYLLHVQGGGRVTVHNQDGTSEKKYLSYDSSNNRSFQMIHKYMVNQGYIPNGSIANQRRFLLEHPDKQEEVFGVCPSYIYFRESDEEPVGVNNIPLTEGRSMAIDTRIYKTVGTINFVKTVRAINRSGKIQKVPFSRFFIAQDTGGAIRGNARCDLYSGYGPEAETVAYNMNELGEQYILIKK